jgi:hypothetical protein
MEIKPWLLGVLALGAGYYFWPEAEVEIKTPPTPTPVEAPSTPVVEAPKPVVPSTPKSRSKSSTAEKPNYRLLMAKEREEKDLALAKEDPLLEDMEVLTLKDARYCPRIYTQIAGGATYYKDKSNRVWFVSAKTGKLTRAQ